MCGNVLFVTRLARECWVGKRFPFELGRMFSLCLVPPERLLWRLSPCWFLIFILQGILFRVLSVLKVPLGAWVWSCSHSRGSSPRGPSNLEVTAFHLGRLRGLFPWCFWLPLFSVFSVVQTRSLKSSCLLIFSPVFHFFVFSHSTDTFPQLYPSTSPMTFQCCFNIFNFQGLIFTIS